MDWLTADLVFKSIATVIGLWILCWICGSALCLVVSEDAPELRARIRSYWRRRRQRREVITRLDALRVIANGQPAIKSASRVPRGSASDSTAGASDQRRDPRLLTGSFGG